MNKTVVYTATVSPLEEAAVFDNALATVSPYRRDKVDRCRSPQDKRLSLGAELLLRRALAEQGIDTYTVARDENGKPFLADHRDLHVNLSHSEDVVMCALSPSAVGCDVQSLIEPTPRLAARCLTPLEQAGLNSQPDNERSAYFTRLWTLKESVVKATGQGLKMGLNSVEFSLGETKTVCVEGVSYAVQELETFAGYAAAVCAAFAGDIEQHIVSLI